MSKAEPRFDRDLKYGQEGEQRIEEFLNWVVSDNGRVEVKRKRLLDLKFYVETHCDKGKTGTYRPSGINVTTASLWCFVIADTGMHVAIPTPLLRSAVLEPTAIDKEETHGNCPTKGKLIHLGTLLWRVQRELSDLSRSQAASTPVTPVAVEVVPGHVPSKARYFDSSEIKF